MTSYAFLFVNVTKYQFNDETFKNWLYFDSCKNFCELTMKPKG